MLGGERRPDARRRIGRIDVRQFAFGDAVIGIDRTFSRREPLVGVAAALEDPQITCNSWHFALLLSPKTLGGAWLNRFR
jgi:hypothetical protein